MTHFHYWHEYKRTGHSVFFCRECRCGVTQVKRIGPMGDGTWMPDDGWNWKHDWELDDYKKARRSDSR